MKKVLKLGLSLLIISMVMTVNVYAVSGNVTMQSTKTEVEKDEEFTVDISLSNLQSNTGVIAFSGTLEYEKNILTLVKMEGQNGWETPTEGVTYNSENGEIVITRNAQGKNDEVIFKITFKVKDNSKNSTSVVLRNAMVADGKTTPLKVETVQKNVTIKQSSSSGTTSTTGGSTGSTSGSTSSSTTGNGNSSSSTTGSTSSNIEINSSSNSSNNSQATNGQSAVNNKNSSTSTSVKDGTTVQEGKLPQTGNNNYTWIAIITLLILVVACYLVKIKLVNKNIEEERKQRIEK